MQESDLRQRDETRRYDDSDTLAKSASEIGLDIPGLAHVVETAAPVYYTVGHARDGVVYNNMVMGELYGPEPEDHQSLSAEKPVRAEQGAGWDVLLKFKITQSGKYRLRVSTVDTAGRSTVVWKPLDISKDKSTGKLQVYNPARRIPGQEAFYEKSHWGRGGGHSGGCWRGAGAD